VSNFPIWRSLDICPAGQSSSPDQRTCRCRDVTSRKQSQEHSPGRSSSTTEALPPPMLPWSTLKSPSFRTSVTASAAVHTPRLTTRRRHYLGGAMKVSQNHSERKGGAGRASLNHSERKGNLSSGWRACSIGHDPLIVSEKGMLPLPTLAYAAMTRTKQRGTLVKCWSLRCSHYVLSTHGSRPLYTDGAAHAQQQRCRASLQLCREI
jgi:hypothetical protein